MAFNASIIISAVVSGAARAAADLGRAFDAASKSTIKLVTDLNRLTNVNNAVRASVNESQNALHSFTNAMNGAFGAATFQQIYKITNQFIGWENQLYAATGSMQQAEVEFQNMLGIVRELGTDLSSSANGFVQLQVAARGTGVSTSEVNEIFQSFSGALSLFNADTLKIEGTFRALTQMFSKGVVQAEELRGQLSEHLPGAFQIAARAIGKTTYELGMMMKRGELFANELLPKMGKQLKKELGSAMERALDTPRAALNRFITETRVFMATLGESLSGEFIAIMKEFTAAMKEMTTFYKENAEVIKIAAGAIAGYVISSALMITSVKILNTAFKAITAIVNLFSGKVTSLFGKLKVFTGIFGILAGAIYFGRDAMISLNDQVNLTATEYENLARSILENENLVPDNLKTGAKASEEQVKSLAEQLKQLKIESNDVSVGAMFEVLLDKAKSTYDQLNDYIRKNTTPEAKQESIWATIFDPTNLEPGNIATNLGSILSDIKNELVTFQKWNQKLTPAYWLFGGEKTAKYDLNNFYSGLIEKIDGWNKKLFESARLKDWEKQMQADYDGLAQELQDSQNKINEAIKINDNKTVESLVELTSSIEGLNYAFGELASGNITASSRAIKEFEARSEFIRDLNLLAASSITDQAVRTEYYNNILKEYLMTLEELGKIDLIAMFSDTAKSIEDMSDKIALANEEMRLLATGSLKDVSRGLAKFKADMEYSKKAIQLANTPEITYEKVTQGLEILQRERQLTLDLADAENRLDEARDRARESQKQMTKEAKDYVKVLIDMREELDNLLLSGLDLDNQLRERTDIYDAIIQKVYEYSGSVETISNRLSSERDIIVATTEDINNIGSLSIQGLGENLGIDVASDQVDLFTQRLEQAKQELNDLGVVVKADNEYFLQLANGMRVSLDSLVKLAIEGQSVAESIALIADGNTELVDTSQSVERSIREVEQATSAGTQSLNVYASELGTISVQATQVANSNNQLAASNSVVEQSIYGVENAANSERVAIDELLTPIVNLNAEKLKHDVTFKRFSSNLEREAELVKLQKLAQEELTRAMVAYISLRDQYLMQGSMTEAQLAAIAKAQEKVNSLLQYENELRQTQITKQRDEIYRGDRKTWDIEFTTTELKNIAESFDTATSRAADYNVALANIEKLVSKNWMTQHEADIAKIEAAYERLPNYAKEIGDAFSDAFQSLITGSASAEEAVVSMLKAIANAVYQELVAKQIASLIGNVVSSFFGGTAAGIPANAGANSTIGAPKPMALGGIMTESGSMQLKRYASGGIANSPQLALFGEGARPEAYVPLPDGRSIPVTVSSKDAFTQETQKPEVKVIVNNLPGQNAEVSRDASGGLTIDIVRSVLANDVNKGGVPWVGAMERRYGMSRGR